MQVDYLHAPSVRLPDLTDDELPDAIQAHVLDRLADVERVEILRNAKSRTVEWASAGNRHERRRAAKLERSKR